MRPLLILLALVVACHRAPEPPPSRSPQPSRSASALPSTAQPSAPVEPAVEPAPASATSATKPPASESDRPAPSEMRLIGIVTTAERRALFVDPHDVGWIFKERDTVKGETVIRIDIDGVVLQTADGASKTIRLESR